jgi:hypothetical protein
MAGFSFFLLSFFYASARVLEKKVVAKKRKKIIETTPTHLPRAQTPPTHIKK